MNLKRDSWIYVANGDKRCAGVQRFKTICSSCTRLDVDIIIIFSSRKTRGVTTHESREANILFHTFHFYRLVVATFTPRRVPYEPDARLCPALSIRQSQSTFSLCSHSVCETVHVLSVKWHFNLSPRVRVAAVLLLPPLLIWNTWSKPETFFCCWFVCHDDGASSPMNEAKRKKRPLPSQSWRGCARTRDMITTQRERDEKRVRRGRKKALSSSVSIGQNGMRRNIPRESERRTEMNEFVLNH